MAANESGEFQKIFQHQCSVTQKWSGVPAKHLGKVCALSGTQKDSKGGRWGHTDGNPKPTVFRQSYRDPGTTIFPARPDFTSAWEKPKGSRQEAQSTRFFVHLFIYRPRLCQGPNHFPALSSYASQGQVEDQLGLPISPSTILPRLQSHPQGQSSLAIPVSGPCPTLQTPVSKLWV